MRTWDKIFDKQAREDGANYQLLKDWLKANFEVPEPKIITRTHGT